MIDQNEIIMPKTIKVKYIQDGVVIKYARNTVAIFWIIAMPFILIFLTGIFYSDDEELIKDKNYYIEKQDYCEKEMSKILKFKEDHLHQIENHLIEWNEPDIPGCQRPGLYDYDPDYYNKRISEINQQLEKDRSDASWRIEFGGFMSFIIIFGFIPFRQRKLTLLKDKIVYSTTFKRKEYILCSSLCVAAKKDKSFNIHSVAVLHHGMKDVILKTNSWDQASSLSKYVNKWIQTNELSQNDIEGRKVL